MANVVVGYVGADLGALHQSGTLHRIKTGRRKVPRTYNFLADRAV